MSSINGTEGTNLIITPVRAGSSKRTKSPNKINIIEPEGLGSIKPTENTQANGTQEIGKNGEQLIVNE